MVEAKVEAKPCIFKLFNTCHVAERAKVDGVEYGSIEWIYLLCTICIKAVYARRYKKPTRKYTVVNTL